jgi:hypothetical protein
MSVNDTLLLFTQFLHLHNCCPYGCIQYTAVNLLACCPNEVTAILYCKHKVAPFYILTITIACTSRSYIIMCSQAVTVCSFSPSIYAQGECFLMRRNCNCNCNCTSRMPAMRACLPRRDGAHARVRSCCLICLVGPRQCQPAAGCLVCHP